MGYVINDVVSCRVNCHAFIDHNTIFTSHRKLLLWRSQVCALCATGATGVLPLHSMLSKLNYESLNNLSTGSCAQVARLFTLCTSPLPPSRGLMMPQLTPSLTLSSRGRLEPAATCAASRSHHTIRERTELACGARTLLATILGGYCAGMKYDPLHTYFTGRGY